MKTNEIESGEWRRQRQKEKSVAQNFVGELKYV